MRGISTIRCWTIACLSAALSCSQVLAEVPPDTMPNSAILPQTYPNSWIYVYEWSDPLIAGYAIIDVAAENNHYKGFLRGNYIPSIIVPRSRDEIYVAETVFARGSTGHRTDLLTLNDKKTLTSEVEIILPQDKRSLMSAGLSRMQLTGDEKFMLIFNFTPAQSVTVVSLDSRTVVSEVETPGCSLIYPNAQSAFSSLCGDGSLTTFVLDKDGHVIKETRLPNINQIDRDVFYTDPVRIGNIAYFSTLTGNVQPIDMSTDTPKALPKWQLTDPQQRREGWRMGSGEYNNADLATDDMKRLYVRVWKQASAPGSPVEATEVWIFDVAKRTRVARIPLLHGGQSIVVTRGEQPYLVVSAEPDPVKGSGLDVYDALTGKFIRQIAGWKPGTILAVAPVHD